MQGDGSLELALEIDEVWNKEHNSTINGIRFKSVYEISELFLLCALSWLCGC
jgi:hypothetical protein